MSFELHALQRRNRWALELPLGLFAERLAPDTVTVAEDLAARRAFLVTVVPRLFSQTRHVFEENGVWYYCRPFLDRVHREPNASPLLNIFLRFMDAAEQDRTLIKGKKPRRPALTMEERIAKFGRPVRGLSWPPEDDAILRRWFSVRTVGPHAGRHAKLTAEEWGYVLAAFDGRRTQGAILDRISWLNRRLRQRYMHEGKIVDGYLSSVHAQAYLQECLGEAPRLPPQRPRFGPGSGNRRPRRARAPASRTAGGTTPGTTSTTGDAPQAGDRGVLVPSVT